MIRKIVVEIIAGLFTLLFVYAAITKLNDYQQFIIQLRQSPMLSPVAAIVAALVPAVELIVTLLLFFSRTRRTGFFLAFALMVMFSIYIVLITNYAKYVPCACGGVMQNMGWTQHLIFNMVFVLLAFVAIVCTEPDVDITTDHTAA